MVDRFELGVQSRLPGLISIPPLASFSKEMLTLRHSLVLFLARAIACPSLTKTHPTGTSSLLKASSAYIAVSRPQTAEAPSP